MGEDITDSRSIYYRFNELFKYLPLGAVVEGKILCVHAGIGSTLRLLDDIEAIQRPCDVVGKPSKMTDQFLLDLLWSDPENESGQSSYKQSPITSTKYDTDRLRSFLADNNLSMLVRSHECVTDGFEKASNGQVMTIFSATDYCGRHSNAAAVVVIRKNFELVPKVIYPTINGGTSFTVEEDKTRGLSKGFGYNPNWADTEETLKIRPATPPRNKKK